MGKQREMRNQNQCRSCSESLDAPSWTVSVVSTTGGQSGPPATWCESEEGWQRRMNQGCNYGLSQPRSG
jgi:hypothetical protein